MSLVNIHEKEAVRYLELNYPEKKNGLDMRMAEDLLACIQQVNADPNCQIIVFASSGRAYFSSGPDVKGLIELAEKEEGPALLDTIVSKLNQVILEIYHSPKITMAAIHGYAYGGGLNLMLACDYRIAEEKAKFIENFYYMGVTPDLSSSYFLPRLIGEARTMELILTGRLFTAKEAAGWGLFHEVVEKRSSMLLRVEELCRQFLSGETQNIVRIKDLMRRSACSALEEQLDLEKRYLIDNFSNPSISGSLRQIHERSFA